MKKKRYQIIINASSNEVYDKMLGLKNKADYEFWTAEFNPTSTYQGSWDEGERIHFIGTGEDGKVGGMVSEIAKNKLNEFISIRHLGILKGDQEILDGPEVDGWKGLLENYFFEESNGNTIVRVETDIVKEYENYFDTTWPKALNKLKELMEK